MPPEVSDIFARLETSKKQYMKTGASDEASRLGPHLVRLSEGSVPDYVKLTKYQEFCWRTMGQAVRRSYKPNPKLELSLLQAHMRMRPEEYVAYVRMTTVIAVVIYLALTLPFSGIIFVGNPSSFVIALGVAIFLFIVVFLCLVFALIVYYIGMSRPASRAKTRARDIDKRIGPAMSFISAMASADVNVDVIFKELSRQDIYGEIKNEAEWITRDTELLGIDILTAVSKAAQRTPSSKFQEFLQGVVTTSTSGGQLKPYFLQKAEQFEKEGKLDMRQQLESLGLLAESFVTVVVAFPLFLIVIMAIMAIVPGGGGGGGFTVLLLWLVVLLMVPIAQFGFIFIIWNSTKEASM